MAKPKSKPQKKPVPGKPSSTKDAAAAFAEVRPEMDALAKDDLAVINTDIPRAVSIAIGAAPHLVALRARFVEELPKHAVQYLDNLEKYALAAWYAHLVALPAPSPENTVKKLMEEGAPLRESLLVGAEALAHAGFFDRERVAKIRSGTGYVDSASDLVALSALFSEHWAAVGNKTAIEWSQVERAAELGPQILVALGERELPAGAKAEELADLRVRAFSLLVRAYDQCRRAAAYLVWGTGDLDEIAPSLFATRGGGRKSSPKDEEDAAQEPAAAEG
ncbi:hypothetical protein [Polyangium aurulentum]|uniref:hypothetical protein n=1 Tax=Polyangium aurulentum TaxID=2567896 RepID=UPI0010ADBF92|nr:hypothetical protein [Polyangium aurulentum]UQA58769.1 hypothetical protein E8A73_047350 [Polyangium aurulentum]